jgi:hypothetical protein
MFYLIFIIVCFLLGIYFIINFDKRNNTNNILEGFIESSDKKGFKCPNVLVQKGAQYYLYNSKLDSVPGVNPIQFDNLEDYVEFMDWQRSQGIRCPILYLQQSYNAQGQATYKIRPDPLDLQGGLPPAPPTTSSNSSTSYYTNSPMSSSMTPSMSSSMTPSMSSSNTTNIIDENNVTNITQQEAENMTYSPNAMDVNWGGEQYTESLIEAGVYADNNVSIAIR